MSALFDDSAALEHEYPMRMRDGAQSVRDYKARPPCHERAKTGLNQSFALGVEIARRLIEDQYPWVSKNRAGDRQPLPLSAAEFHAPLTDVAVVAIG